MTVHREVITRVDNFDRALTLSTTPEGGTGWTIADTSAAGTPTYLTATEDGGGLVLTLANDTEVENVCLYQNDILMYDLAKLQHMWWIAKVASIGATTVAAFGLGSARNDDEDAVATNAWLKIEGAVSTSNLVAESDDGTNDNDDKATGATLSSTYKKLQFDFTNGLTDVRFYVDGDRVASATTFDMSNITAGQNVQPIVQLSKGATAGTPAITIVQFGVQYELAYGA